MVAWHAIDGNGRALVTYLLLAFHAPFFIVLAVVSGASWRLDSSHPSILAKLAHVVYLCFHSLPKPDPALDVPTRGH